MKIVTAKDCFMNDTEAHVPHHVARVRGLAQWVAIFTTVVAAIGAIVAHESNRSANEALPDTDGDGLNDKSDPKPLEMANPIAQGGKPGGIAIKSGIVENNVVPGTSKGTDDHLELEVQNLTDAEIKGVEVFVTLKDSVTGAIENTYRKLPGYTIPKKGTALLHFLPKGSLDFTAVTDTLRTNPNSALYKTPNEKMINVHVAVAGFAPRQRRHQEGQGRR